MRDTHEMRELMVQGMDTKSEECGNVSRTQ